MLKWHKGIASLKKFAADYTRGILHYPYFDGDKTIHVSNGHYLFSAAVGADPEADCPGPISWEAIAAGEKQKIDKYSGMLHAGECTHETFDKVRFPLPDTHGRYPDTNAVTPAADRPVGFRITLNAEYLAALQKAAGAPGVTIEGEYAIDAIGVLVVTFPQHPEAKAVLMAMRR